MASECDLVELKFQSKWQKWSEPLVPVPAPRRHRTTEAPFPPMASAPAHYSVRMYEDRYQYFQEHSEVFQADFQYFHPDIQVI